VVTRQVARLFGFDRFVKQLDGWPKRLGKLPAFMTAGQVAFDRRIDRIASREWPPRQNIENLVAIERFHGAFSRTGTCETASGELASAPRRSAIFNKPQRTRFFALVRLQPCTSAIS
jgi:hypothetical protein